MVTDVKLDFVCFKRQNLVFYRRKVTRINKQEGWVFENLLTLLKKLSTFV